ncbi:MAG: hypothetical protein ABIJ19_00570 [Patescibacteria group bacterium]
MDEIRKGQIALLLFKQRMREQGIRFKPNMRREVANEAKNIGITVDEAMEFLEIVIGEMFDEAFKKEFSIKGYSAREILGTHPDRTKG